jgi:hypothetical protein
MAAPEHVPTKPLQVVRSYESPPRRAGSWMADRPGEIDGLQPEGERLGTPGPDQGYALKLVTHFEGRLTLHDGEHEHDALAGASAIAMKRSGLFGRAPVVHDLTVGLTLWGFLDETPDPELVAIRRDWFDEVHLVHHYQELRRIADAAPDDVLRLPHATVEERHRTDWRSLLDLGA